MTAGNKRKRVLTVGEAAKELRLSRNATYEACASGQIPSIRIGRRILIPKEAFERMLSEPGKQPEAA